MTTRGYPVTKRMREMRRVAAVARQVEYDKLSTQEKLDCLPADGAKKQRARLEAKLKAEKNKSVKEAPVSKEVVQDEVVTKSGQSKKDLKKGSNK